MVSPQIGAGSLPLRKQGRLPKLVFLNILKHIIYSPPTLSLPLPYLHLVYCQHFACSEKQRRNIASDTIGNQKNNSD